MLANTQLTRMDSTVIFDVIMLSCNKQPYRSIEPQRKSAHREIRSLKGEKCPNLACFEQRLTHNFTDAGCRQLPSPCRLSILFVWIDYTGLADELSVAMNQCPITLPFL